MTDHFGFDSTGACHDCARGWCFSHATYTAAGAWGQIDTTPLPSLPFWGGAGETLAAIAGRENLASWFRGSPGLDTSFDIVELVIASLGYLPKVEWDASKRPRGE